MEIDISLRLLTLSSFFKKASMIAPRAPTPAASVGVATPAKMEPRTAKIRKSGGNTLAKKSRTVTDSWSFIAGANLGLEAETRII